MQSQHMLSTKKRSEGKKHFKECHTCRNARRSDEMCKWRRKFIDGGQKTYRRESLVSPIRALYLEATYKESLQQPVSNKLGKFLEKFNLRRLTPIPFRRPKQCN